jgi:HK97 family phage major capsid protein
MTRSTLPAVWDGDSLEAVVPIERMSDEDLAAAVKAADEAEARHMREARANFEAAEREGWTDGRKEAHERFRAGESRLLERSKALKREANLRAGRRRVGEMALNPQAREESFTPPRKENPFMLNPMLAGRADFETAALQVIDKTITDPRAQTTLDALIRDERDVGGILARYVAAAGSREYLTAFARILADPQTAFMGMSEAERQAVRATQDATRLMAASMGIGSGGTGGYAVPVTLDPTFRLTGDGAINPLRRLAMIGVMGAGNVFRPITSSGATAYYGAEASDATEGAPTLDSPPDVYAERGSVWCPFSIEAGQDIVDFGAQLGTVLADARDTLDAVKMISGAGHGSDEPEGLLTGLSASQLVASILNTDHVRALIGDVPPRFAPRSVVMSNVSTLLRVHALVGGGSDEPPVVELGDTPRVLTRPWVEVSAMPDEIMVAGDPKAGFCIADRLGFTIEVAPILINKDTGLPTGERGMLAIWRSGSKTIIPNAFRYIDGSASG